MIISVAGNISSGKTTLAKKICSLYGYTYIPAKRPELDFLEAFFGNIEENFFATQTSFLVTKVLEINEKRNSGENLVIDRSLYEDINIFARYWMENYGIDEKEKTLYKKLSDYLISTVPTPDIYIICRCNLETTLERYGSRGQRKFEEFYPEDYIQNLSRQYEELEFPQNNLSIEVRTDMVDVRSDDTVKQIMSFISRLLQATEQEQLPFLENRTRESLEILTLPHVRVLNNNVSWYVNDITLKRRWIYLAWSFTDFATELPSDANESQYTLDMEVQSKEGVLPKKYKNLLNKLQKSLSQKNQYEVLLPHKDKNNWENSSKSNQQMISVMLNHMKQCDLIVALVTKSMEIYMELAMMAVQAKPMVIIVVREFSDGFYAEGFEALPNVLVMQVSNISETLSVVESEEVKSFIERSLHNA